MQGVWRVFTPGPATFGGRSLLWGLAVSRAFGDLLMKESNVKHRLFMFVSRSPLNSRIEDIQLSVAFVFVVTHPNGSKDCLQHSLVC